MGQAKRRKLLDPYFGKNKTLLQLLIEKDEFFDKPQNIYYPKHASPKLCTFSARL